MARRLSAHEHAPVVARRRHGAPAAGKARIEAPLAGRAAATAPPPRAAAPIATPPASRRVRRRHATARSPPPPSMAAGTGGCAAADIRPDRVIDLHGHTLVDAHAVLAMALEMRAADGARVILVITGKGRRDRPARIKAELTHWLERRRICAAASPRCARPTRATAAAAPSILSCAGQR